MVLHFIRLVLHFHFWVNYRVETHLAYNFFLQNCCKKNLKKYVMLDLFSTDGLLLYERANHLLTIQTIANLLPLSTATISLGCASGISWCLGGQ